MRIAFFTTYYPKYLEAFYKRKQVAHLNSEAHLDLLLDDYFADYGSLVMHARRAGHDSRLILVNDPCLQHKWARENKIDFTMSNWEQEIALAQIKDFQPDVLFMGSDFGYYGDFIRQIKPYCRNVFAWIACAIPQGLDLSDLPLIISSLPSFVDNFRKMGIASELMTAAFDKDVCTKLGDLPKNIDFSFVGGISPAHTQRVGMLKMLAATTPIKVWGYGKQTLLHGRSRLMNLIYKDRLYRRHEDDVWALDMFSVLGRSKITFNAHIDIAGGYAVNMRMFEATGMGALLLTDGKNKEYSLFEDGKEVVYYDSLKDAQEKVRYYLKNEDERSKIALAGQAKTHSMYNYDVNLQQMLTIFQKYMI